MRPPLIVNPAGQLVARGRSSAALVRDLPPRVLSVRQVHTVDLRQETQMLFFFFTSAGPETFIFWSPFNLPTSAIHKPGFILKTIQVVKPLQVERIVFPRGTMSENKLYVTDNVIYSVTR